MFVGGLVLGQCVHVLYELSQLSGFPFPAPFLCQGTCISIAELRAKIAAKKKLMEEFLGFMTGWWLGHVGSTPFYFFYNALR